MDFLTKIAVNLMPVVQDPSFKTGCYGLAAGTIIILGIFLARSILRKRKEKEGKVIGDRSSPGVTFLSVLFFASLSVGILADITEWNEPGKITVLEGGKVISKPQPYLSVGQKKSAVYDLKKEVASSEEPEIPEPVEMKFQDLGTAQADFKFNMKLPVDQEEVMAIHNEFGSQEKLVDEGAKPVIREAIRIGAMLLSSEECSGEKEKKIERFVTDQLEKGLYMVRNGVVIRDEKGEMKRMPHKLSKLKVKFEQFTLENFRKEELVMKIEAEKEKIARELEKIKMVPPHEIPFVADVEKLVKESLFREKSLSKDQKELILKSVTSAKKMLIKLRERSKEKEKKKN